MKVGSVGYCTDQGLGVLLKDFYDHGIVTEVATILHSSRENHLDWFNSKYNLSSRTQINKHLRRFVLTQDVLLFFETPFDGELIHFCRRNNRKTILMPMYECTPELSLSNIPDRIWNPSALDQAFFPIGQQVQVPIPEWIEWRQRSRARTFVFNAGNGGLKGRNGTSELLQAIALVKSPAKFIIRSQIPLPEIRDPRVEVIIGTVPQKELYEEGDVFVFPEKFNGLSLPLQEAKASGMKVLTTNRFPNTEWLSKEETAIRIRSYEMIRPAFRKIRSAVITPADIAKAIDDCYDQNISELSLKNYSYRERNSWEYQKPKYKKLLEELCLSR